MYMTLIAGYNRNTNIRYFGSEDRKITSQPSLQYTNRHRLRASRNDGNTSANYVHYVAPPPQTRPSGLTTALLYRHYRNSRVK